MSLHFLLDGYNIIKQISVLNRGTLENQRQALLNWIAASKPQGSAKNSVTVVFDGKEEFFGSHVSGNTKVIFSKGQSADDLIKKIAEQYPFKKNLIVVSNDKEIKVYVGALGAGTLSVQEFVTGISKRSQPPPGKRSQSSGGKYISLTDQAKINKEFERIWITPREN